MKSQWPLRVVFLTHDTSLYGANRSLLNLIDGLREYNVVPHVVSPSEGEITEVLRNRDVPVVVLPLRLWVSRLRRRRKVLYRLYKNVRLLPVLARQLREWRIDLIYTNSSVLPIGAMLARWMRLPHIWHMREFGDLDYGLERDWGDRVFRRVIGGADAKVFISNAVRSHLLDGIVDESVHVIYNGVSSEADFERWYKQANIEPYPERPYTFAIVGLIHPNKGQEVAIRALGIVAQRFPTTRLLIAGSGGKDYQQKCRLLARQLGVANNVEFWGYIDDPYKAYLAADAVLMCSRYEGMGRTTVEAMSASRPVIGYDQAGTSEIIKHEHTGLFYHGGPEALAACMRRFIENPDWARQLGKNGWQFARKKFTTEVYAEQIYNVLQSVLAARGMRVYQGLGGTRRDPVHSDV